MGFMKTTIDIDATLLRRAKIEAARTDRRLRDIIEEALQRLFYGTTGALDAEASGVREPAALPYVINAEGIPVLRRTGTTTRTITNELLDTLREESGEE